MLGQMIKELEYLTLGYHGLSTLDKQLYFTIRAVANKKKRVTVSVDGLKFGELFRVSLTAITAALMKLRSKGLIRIDGSEIQPLRVAPGPDYLRYIQEI